MSDLQESWPSGATWAFQGTIAEDATAGTHVCTLTVSPGIGNEMQVLYWSCIVGNTVTLQTFRVRVNDGSNNLVTFNNNAATTANQEFMGPQSSAQGLGATTNTAAQPSMLMVSGAMNIVLSVTTAAVSVTQTFAIVCRFRGMSKPTATLNDTIGASTNTVNMNQVF